MTTCGGGCVITGQNNNRWMEKSVEEPSFDIVGISEAVSAAVDGEEVVSKVIVLVSVVDVGDGDQAVSAAEESCVVIWAAAERKE